MSAAEEAALEAHLDREAEWRADRDQYEADRGEDWLLRNEPPEGDEPPPGWSPVFAEPYAGLRASLDRDQ